MKKAARNQTKRCINFEKKSKNGKTRILNYNKNWIKLKEAGRKKKEK